MIENKRSLRSVDLQKGQAVVLLLLVMAIALAVSLSAISRSVLEVSTSRKSEDSSRAFSAAEAGIEKAIQANLTTLGGPPVTVAPFDLSNQTNTKVTVSAGGLPLPNMGLSYPPFGKESFAQFWLVNPSSSTIAPSYTATSFDIYFGDPDTSKYTPPNGNAEDKPAIEVSTIYWDGSILKYMTFVKYFDSSSSPRSGFDSCLSYPSSSIKVNNDEDAYFYCRVNVSEYPVAGSSFPVMVRIRILYSNISHPVAIKGIPETGKNSDIPKQANIYQSSGTSGDVRRTLEVFNQKSVMPQLFDYVLFSAAQLQK